MELWIRSKDKKHLMKCEALMLEQVGSEKWGIRVFTTNYDFNIATYVTKERTLEVLDEIQKILLSEVIIKFDTVLNKDNIHKVKEDYNIDFVECNKKVKTFDTYVYEMPEE